MKMQVKHLVFVGTGLLTLVNVLLLHQSWKSSTLSKEDKITRNLRKNKI